MDIKADGDIEVTLGPVKVKFSPKPAEELGSKNVTQLIIHLRRLLWMVRALSPSDFPGITGEAEVLEKLLQEHSP